MASVQYTVRGVPAELDAELRKEARATGRSLNTVVVEALEQAKLPAAQHDDLDWFVGSAPRGSFAEQESAQAWLDALPSDLA
jgi:predicted transcriptional regulator